MCTVGLLVSTCAYLRGRRATCAQLDYLCLTCAYLRYLYLHLHSCCIGNLPVQTFYASGMISLSNINLPVLKKWFHYLGTHSFFQKNVEMSKNYNALLMQLGCNFETTSFWCTFDVVSRVLMHFWCSFKTASKVHHVFWWFSAKFKEKYVEMSKKYVALLMQFWNYIILMHFWCSFKGFWRIFDVVSKLNCIKSASCFWGISAKIKEKYVEMSKIYDALLMQFWCSFETTSFWCTFDVVSRRFDALSRQCQNCIKTASKVHHVFWGFSANFFGKNVEMPKKNMIHFWCNFKTAPKLHQKWIKFFEHFQQNFEEHSARTSQVSLPVHLSWLLTCKYFEFHNSFLYSYCLILAQ